MSEKLSYEEWKKKFAEVILTKEAKEDLTRSHNFDLHKEIENALIREYEFYING